MFLFPFSLFYPLRNSLVAPLDEIITNLNTVDADGGAITEEGGGGSWLKQTPHWRTDASTIILVILDGRG